MSCEIYHNPSDFYEYYLIYYTLIILWLYMPPIIDNLRCLAEMPTILDSLFLGLVNTTSTSI